MFTRITTENTYQNQKQNKKKLHELTKQEKLRKQKLASFHFKSFSQLENKCTANSLNFLNKQI